jgi:hypothetical protein
LTRRCLCWRLCSPAFNRCTPCGEGAGGAQKRLWSLPAHPPPCFSLIRLSCVVRLFSAFLQSRDQGGFFSVKGSRPVKNIVTFFLYVYAFFMFLMSGPSLTGMLRQRIPECFCAPPAPSPQGLYRQHAGRHSLLGCEEEALAHDVTFGGCSGARPFSHGPPPARSDAKPQMYRHGKKPAQALPPTPRDDEPPFVTP